MTGEEFRQIVGMMEDGRVQNETEFRNLVSELKVIARATAEDKLKLVCGLRTLGRKVAVSGEGINDVEAIRGADVGFSLGSGVEISQQNSDVCLVNDDFEALLRSVMWGRNIYQNIARFLQFQVTVNFSCVLVNFIGILIMGNPPMTSAQLLYVNLVMDMFAVVALATEPPLKSVINGPPYGRDSTLMNKTVWRQIICMTLWNVMICTLVMTFGKLVGGLGTYSWNTLVTDNRTPELAEEARSKKKVQTYVFHTFMFLQLFNMINCRKLGSRDFNVFESFFHNWYFIFTMGLMFAMQYIIFDWFRGIFALSQLKKEENGAVIALGFTALLINPLVKLAPENWFSRLNVGNLANENEKAAENALMSKLNAAKDGKKKDDDGFIRDEGDDEEANNDGFKQI